MPKPPPDELKKRERLPISKEESLSPVSKTTPLAEIILFPNAKDIIPGVNDDTDPNTKTRWLKLADEVMEPDSPPKKNNSSRAS